MSANVGINLVDFSTSHPFLNFFKSGPGWVTALQSNWSLPSFQSSITLDANGYPTITTDGVNFDAVGTTIGFASPTPSGHWACLFDGTGTLAFPAARCGASNVTLVSAGRYEFDFADNGAGIFLAITSTSSAPNNVRNIRLFLMTDSNSVATGYEAMIAAGENFTPTFLRAKYGFKCIRFMEVLMASGSSSSGTPVTWATRPTPATAFWNSLAFGLSISNSFIYANGQQIGPGIPIEICCDLCNQVGCDGWFNIQNLTDDTYVTNFATTVLANLNSPHKAYVTYSNEVFFNTDNDVQVLGNSLLAQAAFPANIPTLTGGAVGAQASGNIQFNDQPITTTDPALAPTTLKLGGTSVQFIPHGGSPSGNQVALGTDLNGTLTALVTFLNASVDANLSLCSYTNNNPNLTLTYKTNGTVGNSFTMAVSGGPWATNCFTAGYNYWAYRTALIAGIWKTAWAGNTIRLVTLIDGPAFGNIDSLNFSDARLPGNNTVAASVDAYAIAPYFGYNLPTPFLRSASGGLNELFKEMRFGGAMLAGSSPPAIGGSTPFTALTLTSTAGNRSTPGSVPGTPADLTQVVGFFDTIVNGASATLAVDGGTAYPLQTSPGVALAASSYGPGINRNSVLFVFDAVSSAWQVNVTGYTGGMIQEALDGVTLTKTLMSNASISLPLVSYEGGPSLIAGSANSSTLGLLYSNALEVDPRTFDAIEQWVNGWAAITSGVLNYFADYETQQLTFGEFGALQSSTEIHTPRQDALFQLVNPNRRGTNVKGGF